LKAENGTGSPFEAVSTISWKLDEDAAAVAMVTDVGAPTSVALIVAIRRVVIRSIQAPNSASSSHTSLRGGLFVVSTLVLTEPISSLMIEILFVC